jgi:hypothetical protein
MLSGFSPVRNWEFLGIALDRGSPGDFDSSVTGDPCIVWDEERGLFHMHYFAQGHGRDGREVNCNAHAVSLSREQVGAGAWRKLGSLSYTNAEALPEGQTHKPWILMDPRHPNRAIKLHGEYWLFTVSIERGRKIIQAGTAPSLDGPWTLRPEAVLRPGDSSDFDGYHVDTVTAYWFAERGEILIFYKGYPAHSQPNQPLSSWGSSLAAAVMKPDDRRARKLGKLISPVPEKGHWLCGWASGMQLLPAAGKGWLGLMTGSPTPPAPVDEEPSMREPAPSLGGWVQTEQEWPVGGWTQDTRPIAYLDELPKEAIRMGMGVNLWRHHLLYLPVAGQAEDRTYLFHNSGEYGRERMFVWRSR